MKKFLKIIGVIILVLVAFVLVAGLFAPKKFRMERDIVINAPQQKVWSNVNSLQSLSKWNPFAEKDPNIQVSYEGTPGTVGSVYKWKGNKDVGQGTQTITGVQEPNRLETDLHFIEPFEGRGNAWITLKDSLNGTKASWGFDTKYPYPMNVMLLFMDMDAMMGKEYNKGLAKLKMISEAN